MFNKGWVKLEFSFLGTEKIPIGYVAMQMMVIKLNNRVIKKGY